MCQQQQKANSKEYLPTNRNLYNKKSIRKHSNKKKGKKIFQKNFPTEKQCSKKNNVM